MKHRPRGPGSSAAIQTVLTTAHAGARELADHGMPAAARAIATTSAATAAIGARVSGWAGPVLGALRPVAALPPHRARRTRSAKSHKRRTAAQRKSRRVSGGRKRRSHAQVMATKKLVRLNKSRKRHAKAAKRSRAYHARKNRMYRTLGQPL
jgi:hypothetical protein